jgi:dihydroneopterin aldolase
MTQPPAGPAPGGPDKPDPDDPPLTGAPQPPGFAAHGPSGGNGHGQPSAIGGQEGQQGDAHGELDDDDRDDGDDDDRDGDDGDDDDRDDEDRDDDGEEESLESVTVEITGLSLYTHHGATAAEREVGQRLVLDLRLDLGEADATATDRLEDTVDYAQVCQLVALVAQQRSHRTLERLCATIAERLLAEYELEGIWVKATKPEPPIPLPVEGVSVEVWREPE